LILTAEQADAFVEALPAAIDRAALATTATEALSAEGGWAAPAGGGR
jgi:hypothetical protein